MVFSLSLSLWLNIDEDNFKRFFNQKEGRGEKWRGEPCGEGATAGSINCCDYFKISGRVYAAVRGKRCAKRVQPTVIPFILVRLSLYLSFFLVFSFYFISFSSSNTCSRSPLPPLSAPPPPPPPSPSSLPPRTPRINSSGRINCRCYARATLS